MTTKLKSLPQGDDNHYLLTNVRVSYPNLFREREHAGQKYKRGASFMLDKDDDGKAIKSLNKIIAEVLEDKNDGKKIPSDKKCFRDGDDAAKERYVNQMVLSTSSNNKIRVMAQGSTSLIDDEDDNEIYDGCYVNAKFRLWFQDNQYGKRVNAELLAIQFKDDGEELAAGSISDESAVEGFDDDEEEYDEAAGF